MEVRVLKENEKELEIELVGEDHTFCNLLKEKLSSKENVLAAYKIEHPLVGNPKFYIKITGEIEEAKAKKIEEKTPLEKIKGLGEKRIEKLNKAGVNYAEDLFDVGIKELSKKTGISEKMLGKIVEEARKFQKSIARVILKEALDEIKEEFAIIKNAV